jgi:hypothetical protein
MSSSAKAGGVTMFCTVLRRFTGFFPAARAASRSAFE